MSFTLRQSILNILYKDITSLRICISWCALAIAYGFFYSQKVDSNYAFMIALMPYYHWGYAFLIYGCTLYVASLMRPHKYILLSIDVLGLWLWTYILLSFLIADSLNPYPVEFILIAPILSVVWMFVDDMFKTYLHGELTVPNLESNV